jgi:hypothetical protein
MSVFSRLSTAEFSIGEAEGMAMDRLDEAQRAWRALSRGERREFLLWAKAWQNERNGKRTTTSPVEKDFAAVLAKMDVNIELQQG